MLQYNGCQLHWEDVPLSQLRSFLKTGEDTLNDQLTPCYVYSGAQIQRNIKAYKSAFKHIPHIIGYSLKANYNPSLLRMMEREKLSVVTISGNEILLCLKTGFAGERIFFYGNGKQGWEIDIAIKNNCVLNVDSQFDAENICRLAVKNNKITKVMVRLNPDISVDVHPFLCTGEGRGKFGVGVADLQQVIHTLIDCPLITVVGVQVHIGSTVQDVSVLRGVYTTILRTINNHSEAFTHLQIISIGGGLGIDYLHEREDFALNSTCSDSTTVASPTTATTTTPSPAPTTFDLAGAVDWDPKYKLMVEPGRSLVANAGLLLTSVLGVKQGGEVEIAVVDAGMNDNIRPSLYSAYHHILPVVRGKDERLYDVAGPVCESADFFGKSRRLPSLSAGDMLAVLDTGAYCGSMASNYNMRGRALEIVILDQSAEIIGRREGFSELIARFPSHQH